MSFTPLTPEQEQEIVKACAIFNLVPPFTMDEAKRRYRDLAKVYHPDAKPLGNQAVFAQMSRSFDVIERNYDLLKSGKFGFLRGTSSVSQSVLEELRETRMQLTEKERRVQALQEETKVLRSAVKGKDVARSLNKFLWGAVTLGLVIVAFIVGITKGFQMPEGELKLPVPLNVKLTASDKSTTHTIIYSFANDITTASLDNAKVKIINKVASFETTPTLKLEARITSVSQARR